MVDASVLQSALDPAGPQAAHINRLWWLMFWVSTGVFAIVMAFLVGAVLRRSDSSPAAVEPELRQNPARERLLHAVVSGAVGLTVIVLFVLLIASIWTGRAIASPGPTSAVVINLTGHQWWWEAEYEDALPSQRVRTANELHIPVGRPVVLKVTSHDVIHSFWVPNLHGKRDLIPGYTTAIWLQADRPGFYRGQCAEFCGRQHANMAIEVVAQSEGDFKQWLENERKVAAPPTDPTAQHGLDVFASTQCVACHTIAGTLAHGQLGPDLTHIATRRTIAAGALPNTRE